MIKITFIKNKNKSDLSVLTGIQQVTNRVTVTTVSKLFQMKSIGLKENTDAAFMVATCHQLIQLPKMIKCVKWPQILLEPEISGSEWAAILLEDFNGAMDQKQASRLKLKDYEIFQGFLRKIM